MSFNNKIEEWIKEIETRPASAINLMRLIANRLSELTERNEQLLAENIALQSGERVEEYQQRIAHLEYQLDLLKRHFGADGLSLEDLQVPTKSVPEPVTTSLLVYNEQGRILRIEIESSLKTNSAEGFKLGRIVEHMAKNSEPPRLLVVPSNDEVILLYSSGRISALSVAELPPVKTRRDWEWSQAALPDEPRAGETLVCITPISQLPVASFFVQVSRRGCIKKTMSSMAQTILGNKFIGQGTLGKSDQPFELTLYGQQAQLAFVTYEGKLIGLDVDSLSYTTEERIRLSATDYVIAAFTVHPEESLIFATQTGKALHRTGGMLELTRSPLAKGQALISANRLEQGIRFMGAASIRDADHIAVLDASGTIKVYKAEAVTGSGTLGTGSLILSIGVIPAPVATQAES